MTRTDAQRSFDVDESEGAGISRRSMLTAGAWSVPVIVMASASPAAAVSAPIVGALRFTGFPIWFDWDDSGHRTGIDGCTTVFLEGDPGGTVGPVTLVVSVPATGMSTATPVIEESPTSWVAQPGVVSGGLIEYTFTWGGTLTAGGAAYTGIITFNLHCEAGVNLIPPISWSGVAMAAGAESGATSGSLTGLSDATALPAQLIVDAGALTSQGDDQLTWSGASIAYSGQPQPAAAEYVAVLRGPDGSALTLLSNASLDVSTTPDDLGTFTYDSIVRTGSPLAPGSYSVTLSVLGDGGVVEETTSAVTL